MVACGAILLDIRTKFHELNFDGEDFVKYCLGTPESIAQCCIALLEDEEDLARRRKQGCEFSSRMPPDEALGHAFMAALGIQTANVG